ncbi:MAG: hypothetical protein JKY70_23245 [Mucilaginibacter sp.]|nr:hypothetical protein [Mucilaginibacter sp.]
MKYHKRIYLTACILLFSAVCFGQTGNTQIQVAAQATIPIGDLATSAKVGRGFAIKGLWGFGSPPQQLTLEAGNNFFALRDKYVVKNVEVSYSNWPIYLGYRKYINKLYTESQFGLAINKLVAFSTDTITASVQQSNAYFAWAGAIGYKLNDFDLEARYQNISIKNSPDIRFISLRIAYSLPFFRKKKIETM